MEELETRKVRIMELFDSSWAQVGLKLSLLVVAGKISKAELQQFNGLMDDYIKEHVEFMRDL